MRKIWTKSSKRRSVASTAPYASDQESIADARSPALGAGDFGPPLSPIHALVIPDYDTRCVKHLWVNGVLNAATSHDFAELLLRLFRVELRGSHLYVFRPPLLLNVRLFRVDSDRDRDRDLDAATAPESTATAATSISDHKHADDAANAATLASSHTAVSSAASTATSGGVAAPGAAADTAESLTYFEPRVPHPDLRIDDATREFLAGLSLESLVHFLVFADASHAAAVAQLTAVLPMFAAFASALGLLHAVLAGVFAHRFGPLPVPTATMCERVVRLFDHVDRDFCGFLLRPDVARHTLAILDLFASDADCAALAARFKATMLSKQRALLDVVSLVDAAAAAPTADSPLVELNSSVFLNNLSLYELAAAVTAIDLDFFAHWNSSIDKLLLLMLSAGDTANSFYKKNPLFFNNDSHVHYLSRLLVHHLFVENPHASAEKRARVLERWIDLGCLLDKVGNMSSWLGVSSVILSQPVLRLTSVWTHVGPDYIKLLKNDWSPVLFELDRRHLANSYEHITFGSASFVGSDPDSSPPSKESYHIMAPRGLGKIYPKEKVIPYFGDLLVNNAPSLSIGDLDAVWRKINYSFDRWNEYLKNLFNADEIIRYNQDVLRRYDAMRFTFSNESLNQVLYLGVNKDDQKTLPASLKNMAGQTTEPTNANSTPHLRKKLLRLLDFNCDSLSLDQIMKLSLLFEPTLRENYLRVPPHDNVSPLHKLNHTNTSSLSLTSVSSSISVTTETIDGMAALKEPSADEKLPTFNNHYFMIDLRKYDDLMGFVDLTNVASTNKHSVVIDSDLTLRLDDFVSRFDPSSSVNTSAAEGETAEDDGLGIDIDDILNSDTFKNFSISQENEQNGESASSSKKHRSFGLVSNSSNHGQLVLVPKFVPRFASIDKLIDLLLIDSKYLDESHPIDLTEYRFVFMLNYSSFMTTKELLEKLAHRFVHSGNAVISVMKKHYLVKQGQYDPVVFGSYPNWDVDVDVNLRNLGDVDYELLLKIQVNILKALIVLVNNFFSNFSNDLKNKKIMIKLLKLYSNEILQWYNSNKIDHSLDKSFENLVNYYKRLKKLFVKKSYRPVEALKFEEFLTHEFKFSNTIHEVPMNRNLPSHKNLNKIDKFLTKFNKLLTVFYKGITPENWFKIFKILENLFENHSLLNYQMQRSGVPEDYIAISNVMSYFETLYDLSSRDLVLKKLPIVFNKLFKLYYKFRSYLLIQLCDLNITTEERLDRMKTLLLMMKISKLKMSDSQFVFDGDLNEIPSCIETAITNVIYSPESRLFSSLWIKAATSLNPEESDAANMSFDTIASLLPAEIKQSDLLIGDEPLLPCFGWIIENLLQINKCPSFYRNSINFNKRYLIFKLVKELSVEDVDENEEFRNDTKEFEFLMRLNESLCNLSDLKLQIQSDRVTKKLFRLVIKEQYAILALDGRRRAYRDSRHALESGTAKESQLVKKSSNSALARQSLSYKTNSSSRFKISGLFSKTRTFSLGPTSERVVSFRELPDPSSVADPKSKPVLVIQLKDRKIFPVYLLPNCFKMDHDSSNDVYFFQAPSESESREWLKRLTYANRHWFFSKQITLKSSHDFTTFGVPLQVVCSRDHAASPRILEVIYAAIEKDGLKDVGIYRISTSISELNSIKNEIDRTGTIDFQRRSVDTHALTSCIKLYFRELPDAVLTDEVIELCYPMRPDAAKKSGQSSIDFDGYKKVLAKLPEVNYATLKSLIRHLNLIVQHNEDNRMNAFNLATVIGPALTEASSLDSLINNFGVMNCILEQLIDHYADIFEEKAVDNVPAVPDAEVLPA